MPSPVALPGFVDADMFTEDVATTGRVGFCVHYRLVDRAGPLAEHAVGAGFFDQAHMAREYRLLTGMAPGRSLADEGAATALGASQLAPRFFAR